MGGCVGTGRRSVPNAAPSDSSSSQGPPSGHLKNRPLKHEKIRWKSDIPLTDGQLLSKREEFWDTAPAFEGKPEIWSALRAAAQAAESGEDFELAQAILDGAGISTPSGSLVESYDELGTRYAIPVYCLSFPLNLVTGEETAAAAAGSKPSSNGNHGSNQTPASSLLQPEPEEDPGGPPINEMKIKVRISLTSSSTDVKLFVNSEATVGNCKKKLQIQEKLKHSPSRQRWYYGGKLLHDKSKIGKFGIPSGYVVQCVLNNLDFDIIETKD
eukprot:TRINITY_DN2906_c0_g1_i1.p1 TRINITY_DN2906_c0_g1~~TRINITY_DN2906_c0_g1_i1.p1  ORF type:complete len:270 (+),score=115.39 TRINITY_DN2906_c0_g1_i1:171-980(+)